MNRRRTITTAASVAALVGGALWAGRRPAVRHRAIMATLGLLGTITSAPVTELAVRVRLATIRNAVLGRPIVSQAVVHGGLVFEGSRTPVVADTIVYLDATPKAGVTFDDNVRGGLVARNIVLGGNPLVPSNAAPGDHTQNTGNQPLVPDDAPGGQR